MNIHTILFIAFSSLVALYLWTKRREFERHGILFIQRTKAGLDALKAIHRWNPGFWKWFSRFSVFVSVLGMLAMGHIAVSRSVDALLTGVSPISLVLPSSDGSFSAKPGLVLIPLWLWVAAIALIVFPHEMMHGVISISERVRVKSTGLAFLLVIPGAFVEPDERRMKGVKKLKIAAAGPAANILIGLFLGLVVYAASIMAFQPAGVEFASHINGSDAMAKNLSGTIVGINNVSISSVDDLRAFLDTTNDTVFVVETTNGTYTISPYMEGGRKMIGISGVRTSYSYRLPAGEGIVPDMLYYLSWLASISLGVGLVNLLPFHPFDGGHMLDVIVRNKRLRNSISWGIGILMLVALSSVLLRLAVRIV